MALVFFDSRRSDQAEKPSKIKIMTNINTIPKVNFVRIENFIVSLFLIVVLMLILLRKVRVHLFSTSIPLTPKGELVENQRTLQSPLQGI
jgi:hypothetical protein